MGYEYVEGVFGGQALKLTNSRLKTEKENLQSVVLYARPNNEEEFYFLFIHKTGAYQNSKDVIEVSIIGLAGDVPEKNEWIQDIVEIDNNIVYINEGFTIDELMLLDYIPEISEIEAWYDSPIYDPGEIRHFRYSIIEQTEQQITIAVSDLRDEIGSNLEDLEESVLTVTSDKIESSVRKSLLSSSIATLSQAVEGSSTSSLFVTPLIEGLTKGTRLVIMDKEELDKYSVIVKENTDQGATTILIKDSNINAAKGSTIHIEQAYQASRVNQLADSYSIKIDKDSIEDEAIVTGFRLSLGDDDISDFVIQADRFRLIGTKNNKPFGEGISVFEINTIDNEQRIFLNSDVIIKGNLVQSSSGEDEPFPLPAYRGEYKSHITYHRGDHITHAGASWLYVYHTPTTGNEPVIGSQFWDLYTERGADGRQGVDGAPGKDGKGVVSAIVEYKMHTSGTTAPSGSWSTSIPTNQPKGQYLWTRTTTTYTDASEIITYSVAYIPIDGQSGEDGKGIKSTLVEYKLHTSGTVAPDGTWSTSVPTPIQGRYLWTRTTITYTDNSHSVTYSTSYHATDGQKGDKGDKGDTGVGVASIQEKYAVSTSGTTAPANSAFQSTVPTLTATNKYLWNYEIITYTDNTSASTDKRVIGVYGDKGTTGDEGVGINEIEEYYAVSTSRTTAPSSFSQTVPTLTATNKYLWNYEKIIYTDGSTKETNKRVIGVYGDKGDKGDRGPQGQGVVYRGPWQSGETYYYTDVRRDVVKYNNEYRLFNVYSSNPKVGTITNSWNNTQWDYFGAVFESVATKLLLAENAFIDQTLNIGSSESTRGHAGISSVGSVRFWAGGPQNSSNTPFRVTEDGIVYAIEGRFKGHVIGAVYA